MQYFKYIITILFVDGICTKSHPFAGNGSRQEFSSSTHRNIRRLNLSNGNLLILKRGTFNKYRKLQELNVINSGVSLIDDGAFHDLARLRTVNVAKNFITQLRSNIFKPNNKLRKLVVADNKLDNLDSFDINYFPKLAILDISNNKMKSLPDSLLEKLRKDANFTVMTANNPWDCTNPNWTIPIGDKLFLKFCNEAFEELPTFLASRQPLQAGFINCAFYMAGAFWCGIIVGNLCLIRKILWRKNKKTMDQSTQYETFNCPGSRKHSVTAAESRLLYI